MSNEWNGKRPAPNAREESTAHPGTSEALLSMDFEVHPSRLPSLRLPSGGPPLPEL